MMFWLPGLCFQTPYGSWLLLYFSGSVPQCHLRGCLQGFRPQFCPQNQMRSSTFRLCFFNQQQDTGRRLTPRHLGFGASLSSALGCFCDGMGALTHPKSLPVLRPLPRRAQTAGCSPGRFPEAKSCCGGGAGCSGGGALPVWSTDDGLPDALFSSAEPPSQEA